MYFPTVDIGNVLTEKEFEINEGHFGCFVLFNKKGTDTLSVLYTVRFSTDNVLNVESCTTRTTFLVFFGASYSTSHSRRGARHHSRVSML